METRVVFVSPTPILGELVALVPDPGERATSSTEHWHSITVLCDHPDPDALRTQLRAAAGDVAVAVITGPLATQPARLILCDVDSTFTTTEAVDLLAAHAGSGPQVAEITERAMRGELDFEASLRARVATLKGLPTTVFDAVGPAMTLSPGALDMVAAAHAVGALVGVTSGGFTQLVDPMAAAAGLDFTNANVLETEVTDGVEVLTGNVTGTVVDRAQKARDLARFAAAHDVDPALTVCVGDGANDLDMLEAAGLGVAYCAKPITAERADVAVAFPRLDAIVPIALQR
ncbi:hypothetical protein GCM10028820_13300 [Tessaracoccus terricola]